jgi:hypothetical protein
LNSRKEKQAVTYSQTAPPQAGAPIALKKPGTLLALVVISAISALSGLVSSIFALAGGRDLAERYATDVITNNPEELGVNELLDVTGGESAGDAIATLKEMDLWDTIVATGQAELIFKSVWLLACVVPLLLFALFAINGATWSRILITIFAVFSLLPQLIMGLSDSAELQLLQIMGFIGLGTAIVAIVLSWLPANNRYAKARKMAKLAA